MRVILILGALLGGVSTVWPCALAYRPGSQLGITDEAALIVYDEEARMEHFVRRATFRTDTPYFGFLVPTPSLPHLAEVSESLFADLARFTAPEKRTEVVTVDRSLWDWGLTKTTFAVGAASPTARSAVEVIDRQKVAGMEATILRATDAEKLREWLNQHGYEARPALTEWLKVYVDRGWFLTAFQYKKPENAERGVTARAVRISFATERPFYPYREPADGRADKAQGSRTLRVFFASTMRAAGTLGEKGAWPGETVWSAPLPEAHAEQLRLDLADPRPAGEHTAAAVQLPETVWLTEFVDRSSPRPGTDEVTFRSHADQSVVKRPPDVTYEFRQRLNPRELTAVSVIGAALLLGIGFFTLRYLRSPAQP